MRCQVRVGKRRAGTEGWRRDYGQVSWGQGHVLARHAKTGRQLATLCAAERRGSRRSGCVAGLEGAEGASKRRTPSHRSGHEMTAGTCYAGRGQKVDF